MTTATATATALKNMTECPKCGGTGRLAHYTHIDSGICFKCKGIGKVKYQPMPERSTSVEQEYLDIANKVFQVLKTQSVIHRKAFHIKQGNFSDTVAITRYADSDLECPEMTWGTTLEGLALFIREQMNTTNN